MRSAEPEVADLPDLAKDVPCSTVFLAGGKPERQCANPGVHHIRVSCPEPRIRSVFICVRHLHGLQHGEHQCLHCHGVLFCLETL